MSLNLTPPLEVNISNITLYYHLPRTINFEPHPFHNILDPSLTISTIRVKQNGVGMSQFQWPPFVFIFTITLSVNRGNISETTRLKFSPYSLNLLIRIFLIGSYEFTVYYSKYWLWLVFLIRWFEFSYHFTVCFFHNLTRCVWVTTLFNEIVWINIFVPLLVWVYPELYEGKWIIL